MVRIVGRYASDILKMYYSVATVRHPWAGKMNWYYEYTYSLYRNDAFLWSSARTEEKKPRIFPAIMFNSKIKYPEKILGTNKAEKEIYIEIPPISVYGSQMFVGAEIPYDLKINIRRNLIDDLFSTVAYIVEDPPLIFMSSIPSSFNLFGIYVLDLVLDVVEQKFPEMVEKIYSRKAKSYGAQFLRKRYSLHEIVEMFIDFDREEVYYCYYDPITKTIRYVAKNNFWEYPADDFKNLVNAFIYADIRRLKDIVEYAISSTNRIAKSIKNEMEKIEIYALSKLSMNKFPVIQKNNNIYVVYPFTYEPTYVKMNNEVRIIPTRTRTKIRKNLILGFRVRAEDGLDVEDIVLMDINYEELRERMPHYNGVVCYGTVPIKTTYSTIPSFEEFYKNTIKPLIINMDMINLDSAYDCKITRTLRRGFKRYRHAEDIFSS